MENIYIPLNDEYPEIDFNASTGRLLIRGTCKSFSGTNDKFFMPLVEWAKEYAKSPAQKTVIDVQLDYFGTEVSKLLLWIFRELDYIFKAGHQVCINWFYEEINTAIFEMGEEYKSVLGLPLNLIRLKKAGS